MWPLLFALTDLSDLFFILNTYDLGSYANNSTPYVAGKTLESIFVALEKVSVQSLNDSVTIKCNQMQINVRFYQVLISMNRKQLA